jgi:hypothetical protein
MNTSTTYPITTTGTTEFVPRETLATFTDYRSAQSMVDRLSDAGFPVATARITGTGLRAVEYVTGRLTRGGAVLRGALSGLWFGLFLTLIFGLFLPGPAFGLLFGAPLFAALWGGIFGFVGHGTTRGQRDFSSVSGFEAEQFEVTVAAAYADRARAILA